MLQSIQSSFTIRRLALPLSLACGLLLLTVLMVQAMGAIISGTVSSPGGYPLPAGTVVKLFEPGTEAVFGQASVDLNTGAFSLGPVPNGPYVVRAVPPLNSGFTPSLPKPVAVFNEPVQGVALSLTTPQITGTVFAPNGVTPVSATVRVILGEEVTVQTVPAPAGVFAISGLPAGNYLLQAHPAVDEPFWQSPRYPVNLTGGPTQSISLTLTPAQLWGVAQDPQGHPVANALVLAIGPGDPPHRQGDQTSPSGFWAIGGLTPGEYRLRAEPPFQRPELIPPEPIPVTLPGATNPYTLTFGTVAKLVKGKVTIRQDEGEGAPVNHALVLANRVDRHGHAETFSAADGSYELRLAPGLWAMQVRPVSSTIPANWVYPRPPQLVYFERNDQPETKIQNFVVLVADAQVTGQVELPGGGTPPFTVTVALYNNEGHGRRTEIEPDGTFSLAIPHGGYKVFVQPHDPGFLGPILEPIHVGPGASYDLGTITLLAKDAAISGTVRDSNGTGVEGIPVTARRQGAPNLLRTRTGPGGVYFLPVVAGRWYVQPAPGPDQPYNYEGEGTAVTVAAGQIVPDIDFTLVTADAVINGQLVDSAGNAISDVDGWAVAVNPAAPARPDGAPIRDGAFSIYVTGGTYNVAARLPAGSPYLSGAARNVSVNPGQAVTITLTVQEKNAIIRGALHDIRNGTIVTGVEGFVAAWAEENWAGAPINPGNGSYSLRVAPGLWHVGYRIDPTSRYVKVIEGKNVPVQAGQTVEVPLPVVFKDGRITGTVLAPNGSPLAGVTVVAEGTGPVIDQITLQTLSRADGSFVLAVPHGKYRLGALGGRPNMLKPLEIEVIVRPGETSGGHVLQFQAPNARLNGTLTISGTNGLNGEARVWAWSERGGFTTGRFPIVNSTGVYSLGVISGTTWHVGAAFETGASFWGTRVTVTVNSNQVTQDLVLTGPYPKPGPVVITFDAADPQRIELADGTHIFIPAGAMPVEGEVTLRIIPIATLPHQRHANVYKYGYAFLATDNTGEPIEEHFNQDVIIAFTYEDAELVRLGIREAALRPAYFSTTTDHWTAPDSYAVDTERNRVTMQIDHFTDFALTASAETTTAVYLPIVVK